MSRNKPLGELNDFNVDARLEHNKSPMCSSCTLIFHLVDFAFPTVPWYMQCKAATCSGGR